MTEQEINTTRLELKETFSQIIKSHPQGMTFTTVMEGVVHNLQGIVFKDEHPFELALGAAMLAIIENGLYVADFVKVYNHYHPEHPLTTAAWFAKTDPEPTAERLNAQFGCHLEEVAEMFPEIKSDREDLNDKMRLIWTLLSEVGKEFKEGRANLEVLNGGKLLDSVGDQFVTGTGLAQLAKLPVAEAVARIDVSNFTKFENGVVLYKDGGKVKKGKFFTEPAL